MRTSVIAIGILLSGAAINAQDQRATPPATPRDPFSGAANASAAAHDKAGDAEIISREVVTSGEGYFPVLVRLRSGRLLTVFRGGGTHISIKGRLDIATSDDNGKSWSAPRTAVDSAGDDRNPALGQMANGDVVLAYVVLTNYNADGTKLVPVSEGTPETDGVYVLRSSDDGKTWSKPVRNPVLHEFASKGGRISPFGKIAVLEDGTALMSVYRHVRGGDQSFLFRSTDNGHTWGDASLITTDANETGILSLGHAKLVAAARSDKDGSISVLLSDDAGRSWSAPQRVTRSMEHPGDLVQLHDGTIVLSFSERNRPFGAMSMRSSDGGKAWSNSTRVTLADDAFNGDCGYPSTVQLPDGRLLTVYYAVADPKAAPASARLTAVVWQLR